MLSKPYGGMRTGPWDCPTLVESTEFFSLPLSSQVGVDAAAPQGRVGVLGQSGQWAHARFSIVGGTQDGEWLDVVFELYAIVGGNEILLRASSARNATHRIENGIVYADVLFTDPGGVVSEGFRVKARCNNARIGPAVKNYFSLWLSGENNGGGAIPEWTSVTVDGLPLSEAQFVNEPCHVSMIFASSLTAIGSANVRFVMLFDTIIAIPFGAVPPITPLRLEDQASRSISLGGKGMKFDAGLRIGISTTQRTFSPVPFTEAAATAWIRTP